MPHPDAHLRNVASQGGLTLYALAVWTAGTGLQLFTHAFDREPGALRLLGIAGSAALVIAGPLWCITTGRALRKAASQPRAQLSPA